MKKRNYWAAIVLGVLGGFCGLEAFYVGKTVAGVFAVLFCWTGIPAIVGLIRSLVWLFEGEDEFNAKYNKQTMKPLND